MDQRTIIIVNTAISYLKTVLTAGLGIFSSRWILERLGASGWGLFTLVGCLMVSISLFNGAMAAGSVRFFAFSIGRNSPRELRQWFNSALAIHTILPGILVVLGYPVGIYLIRHVLKIAPDQVEDGVMVFRFSLLMLFFSMVSIPYVGLLNAKQQIASLALLGIVESICCFFFAYLLLSYQGNGLFFYAAYYSLISVFFCLVKIGLARRGAQECRCDFKEWFIMHRLREIFRFSAWNLFGDFACSVRYQGTGFVINLFFGTTMNAAYGIASTISNHASNLSIAMQTALTPVLTYRAGERDYEKMLKYVFIVCKYGTLSVALISIPVFCEMDYLLKIWLVTPPPHTVILAKSLLIVLVVEKLAVGHVLALNAVGHNTCYNLVVGICNMLSVPFMILLLMISHSPIFVLGLLVSSVLCTAGRVWIARVTLHISVLHWLKSVILPVFIVVVAGIGIGLLPHLLLKPSLIRLLITGGATTSVLVACTWFLGATPEERQIIRGQIRSLQGKIFGRKRYCTE